ncbi:MAG TPA: TIGR02117 family protein [Bacteroidales bacterium]|nr:TIGR02117 family protein [Bacteroidales bacterium]
MKKVIKIIALTLSGIITFVVLYFVFAIVLSVIPVNKNPENAKEIPVYILTNGAHTDIVVPVKTDIIDWSEQIKYENTLANDTSCRLLALGWGDKGFYLDTPTWADLKFSTAFKAVFGINTAAIHATYYRELRENDSCKKIEISKEQYKDLVAYIQKGFLTTVDGDYINIVTDANYGMNDAFYEGKGRFNMFRTCNAWTNRSLKACGQRACVWTPFDKGIFYHYK